MDHSLGEKAKRDTEERDKGTKRGGGVSSTGQKRIARMSDVKWISRSLGALRLGALVFYRHLSTDSDVFSHFGDIVVRLTLLSL